MPLVDVVLDAAADTRIPSTGINSLALLAQYADANGIVGPDEEGRSLADPRNVAAHLGAGASTVTRAFGMLEQLGYIRWTRSWKSGPHNRPGSVQIIQSRSVAA
ncbi:helix-turn-helix domain-containing protein (plasmid) [Skermanella rosea]|uniref:hypothetical protein n=1 Tax=Skermanella rosea TaxID=1817965 RepID=UPI001932181C|nr:hypothetical protein [Skermanella rosea]UEM08149.1 helix-turn-helix domain-containing protein [Skermanella rosea]